MTDGRNRALQVAAAATTILLIFTLMYRWRSDARRDESPNESATANSAHTVKDTAPTPGSESNPATEESTAFTSTPSADMPTNSTFAELTGQVFAESGRPLPGTRITLRADRISDAATVARADGRFALRDVPPGLYRLSAYAKDYVPITLTSVTLVRGRNEALRVVLPGGITVRGRVQDEQKNPIPHANLTAQSRRSDALDSSGRVFSDPRAEQFARSEDDGTFVVAGLADLEHYMNVEASGYTPTQLDFQPREVLKQPLLITMLRGETIKGRVVNESGQPMAGVQVSCTPSDAPITTSSQASGDLKTTTTAADGEFVMTKLSSDAFYDVTARRPGFAMVHRSRVPSRTTGLVLELTPGGSISGNVAYLDRESTPAIVTLEFSATFGRETFRASCQSEANGRFRIETLPIGRYTVQSATPGVTLEAPRPIVLTDAQSSATIQLEAYASGQISGEVVDAEALNAVPRAKVRADITYGLLRSRKRTANVECDERGRFLMESVPAGSYQLTASAPGYLPSGQGTASSSFALQSGEFRNDVQLRISQGGRMRGVVSDPRGAPVPDAEVQVYLAQSTPTRLDIAPLKSKTNAQGGFEILAIPILDEVHLHVSARHSVFGKTRSSLTIMSPDKPEAFVAIKFAEPVVLRGKITSTKGSPIADARVELQSHEFPGDPSSSRLITTSDPGGNYEIRNAAPGAATLRASARGYLSASKRLLITGKNREVTLNLTLKSGSGISGEVKGLNNRPIPGARVVAEPREGAEGTDATTTDKEGRFDLPNIGDGIFRIVANFTRMVDGRNQAYTFYAPEVPGGTSGVVVDCDMEGSLSGLVLGDDEEPLSKFRVVLRSNNDTVPKQWFAINWSQNPSGSKGFFRFLEMPRGSYTLELSADGYENYTDKFVSVGPGTRTELPAIKMKPAGGVAGTVIAADTRNPVAGVMVSLYDASEWAIARERGTYPRIVASASTNYAGRFLITSAPPGTYRLRFQHSGYFKAEQDLITLSARRLTDLGTIVLQTGTTVQGRVSDMFNRGAASVTVRLGRGFPWNVTRTNRGGNYMLSGVPLGRVPIVVVGRVSGRVVYAYQYFDVRRQNVNVVDFRIDLSANLDIYPIASSENDALKSCTVRVHPFDEVGNVVESVRYEATKASGAASARITGIPPGRYKVLVVGQTMSGAGIRGESIVTIQRGANRADVVTVSGP